MDLLTFIQGIPAVGPYIPYLMVLITVGAAVATSLPPPSPTSGTGYKFLYEVVQWCALNKGHAANATAPK